MKNNNKKYLVSSFAFLLVLAGCAEKTEQKPAAEQKAVAQKTIVLEKKLLQSNLNIPAEVRSDQEVDLYAKVSGYVKDIKADIGSKVRKGQLLATLEAPEVSSQLAGAKSRMLSQKAIYTASNSNYQRLFETSKVEGTISTNDIEQAIAKKESDHAQFLSAEAKYREIAIMQSYLQIRAPFDGVISSRNTNLGAFVGPGSGKADLPLFRLEKQDKLRLSLFVPERYSGFLSVGDSISFKVKSLQNRTFKAQITRKSGALDQKLRSEKIELDLVNTDGKLLSGMIADVSLKLSAKNANFVVPKSAVVQASDGTYIFVIKDNKLEKRDVQMGRMEKNEVEIFGDLNEGNSVLEIASEETKDGSLLVS